MTLPRLYAITDESVLPDDLLLEGVQRVLDAGVRLLQVRFKTSSPDERLRLGRTLRSMTGRAKALLVINDHPELAAEINADGVHLGEHDPAVEHARSLLGPDAIVGVSAYDSMDRVRAWGPEQISYLGVSSPYSSTLKETAMPSFDQFASLVSASRVPVYGIGGIIPERIGEMIRAGCHGVAAVTAIFGAQDPAAAVGGFLEALPRP
ncbi:MAG: thiamine phosphate synthase [Deltaproteobacteria bacterium]|nr:thiamine phosphate synthase [Deltaproteobacteria bacterium]